MKIRLSNSKLAYIDAEDFEIVSQYRWHFDGRYATANLTRGKKLYLHRLVLGLKQTGRKIQVDHLNENKLDCRKHNLVIRTEADHKRRHVGPLHEKTDRYKVWEIRRERYGPSGYKAR
jgi:hypothetical protein